LLRDPFEACAIDPLKLRDSINYCAIADRASTQFWRKTYCQMKRQRDACGESRSALKKSTFHPLGVPQLVEECFNQLLGTAQAIHDPFEQSFFAMVHLPYLQPFDDVNKRVSRLAANIPFIKRNLYRSIVY